MKKTMMTSEEYYNRHDDDDAPGCRSLAICLLIATIIWGVIIYFIAK